MTVILISGLPGCGSSTTGKLLAGKLGLKFFSVGKEYKEKGSGNNETEKAINFLSSEKGANKQLHESLDDKQKRLAKEGNIVIDSKLGIHFLKNSADLTVWLYASFDTRAERVAKREQCDLNKAKKILAEKEKLEHALFLKVYDFDYLSQKDDADLVLDVNSMTTEDAMNLIVEKLNKFK